MRVLTVLMLLAAFGNAATFVVDGGGGADFTEIQPAIDAAAAAGDEVLVKPGEYVITAPISFLGKAITVRSESGAEATTLLGVGVPRVVSFASGEPEAARLGPRPRSPIAASYGPARITARLFGCTRRRA